MDASQFDALARRFQTAPTRRSMLASLVSGFLASHLIEPGWDEASGKKKRKKKRKKQKPPSCQPSCSGKSCGDADGCGGSCTACPAGLTCQNRQCVSNDCAPSCHGGHVCHNGSCVCPAELQECNQNWCGECCSDAECPGFPNANSLKCIADGDKAMFCGCLSGVDCGNGRCVQCCNSDYCLLTFGPGMFCNVNGGCVCPEDTTYCSRELGCVDTQTNRNACGPNCTPCGARAECEAGRCCVGLANDCVFSDDCCADLGCVNIGTVFEPHFVCGGTN